MRMGRRTTLHMFCAVREGQSVELGPAEIDDAVAALRQARLRDSHRTDVRTGARARLAHHGTRSLPVWRAANSCPLMER